MWQEDWIDLTVQLNASGVLVSVRGYLGDKQLSGHCISLSSCFAVWAQQCCLSVSPGAVPAHRACPDIEECWCASAQCSWRFVAAAPGMSFVAG